MPSTRIGRMFGLEITVSPSAWLGSATLWVVLSAAGMIALQFAPVEAILGGLAATILHYLSELAHQCGHAIAARRTGYPMTGVRFWAVFGASVYPDDEPDLPPATHIRRALGGAPMSAVIALIGAAVALMVQPLGGVAWALALFFTLDNLLVFCLGAFLPLGFTDGSTILRNLGK